MNELTDTTSAWGQRGKPRLHIPSDGGSKLDDGCQSSSNEGFCLKSLDLDTRCYSLERNIAVSRVMALELLTTPLQLKLPECLGFHPRSKVKVSGCDEELEAAAKKINGGHVTIKFTSFAFSKKAEFEEMVGKILGSFAKEKKQQKPRWVDSVLWLSRNFTGEMPDTKTMVNKGKRKVKTIISNRNNRVAAAQLYLNALRQIDETNHNKVLASLHELRVTPHNDTAYLQALRAEIKKLDVTPTMCPICDCPMTTCKRGALSKVTIMCESCDYVHKQSTLFKDCENKLKEYFKSIKYKISLFDRNEEEIVFSTRDVDEMAGMLRKELSSDSVGFRVALQKLLEAKEVEKNRLDTKIAEYKSGKKTLTETTAKNLNVGILGKSWSKVETTKVRSHFAEPVTVKFIIIATKKVATSLTSKLKEMSTEVDERRKERCKEQEVGFKSIKYTLFVRDGWEIEFSTRDLDEMKEMVRKDLSSDSVRVWFRLVEEETTKVISHLGEPVTVKFKQLYLYDLEFCNKLDVPAQKVVSLRP